MLKKLIRFILSSFKLFLLILPTVLEALLLNHFFFSFSLHEKYLLFSTWLFTKFIIKNSYTLFFNWRILINCFKSIIIEFRSLFLFLSLILIYYKFINIKVFLIYYSIPLLTFLNLPRIVDAIKLKINEIISVTITNLRGFGKTLDLGELLLKLIFLTFFMYYFFKNYIWIFFFYWIIKLTLTFLLIFEVEIFQLKSDYLEKWHKFVSSKFTNQENPSKIILTWYKYLIRLTILLFLFDTWRMRISIGFWISLWLISNPTIIARLHQFLLNFKTMESKIITSLYLIFISICFIYIHKTLFYEIITNSDWESIFMYGDIRAASLNNLFPENKIRSDLWDLFWGYYTDIPNLLYRIVIFWTTDSNNILLPDRFFIDITKVFTWGPDFNIFLCIATMNLLTTAIRRTSKYSLHYNNLYFGIVFWNLLDFVFFDRFLWTFFLLWLYIVLAILIKGGNNFDKVGNPIPANRLWMILKVTGFTGLFFFGYFSLFFLH